MASVTETRTIDADQHTLWRCMADIPRYAEWQVLPSGKVVKAALTRDAGVLTGSTRRVELSNGRWFEETFYEAAAPNYVAYEVEGDSSGKFNRQYKKMTISIKMIPAPGGGTNVTLGVNYTKTGFLGRWLDFGGPGAWRKAFRQSLVNLAELIARAPKAEVFTPAWQQPPTPTPPPPTPPLPDPPVDTTAIETELAKLRTTREQMAELGVSTDEIDARITALESKLAQ